MSQYMIDEPFDDCESVEFCGLVEEECVSIRPLSIAPACIVASSVGDEIVPLCVFDEDTVIIDRVVLDALLAHANPNKHLTVEMKTVGNP